MKRLTSILALTLISSVAYASPNEGAHAPSGDHGAEAGHGDGGHHKLDPINWFDFSNHEQLPYAAALINLAILLALYVKVGKKPITEALKNRRDGVARDIEEAARLKQQAEARAEKYQADLSNLDKDLEIAKQALVDAGKKEQERIVAEATERAERMKRDADRLLEQEAKQKQHDLTLETIDLATEAAHELLRTKLTARDHLQLAEELIADLAKQPDYSTRASAEVAS